MEDGTLRCPSCGAPAAADAESCTFCHAPFARITCAKCFAPMFLGTRFCPHCGAAAMRAEVDDTPLPCPRCKSTMQGIALGSTSAHECETCGGLWIDPDSLQKLVNTREEHSAVIGVLAARTPPNVVPATEVIHYVPCPKCKKLMNRVNFAHSSGVIVDVCKSDGVWLDRGELQRVIDFVEHGGLDASRQNEREKLVAEQQRLLALQQTPLPGYKSTDAMWVSQRASTVSLDHFLSDALGLFHN